MKRANYFLFLLLVILFACWRSDSNKQVKNTNLLSTSPTNTEKFKNSPAQLKQPLRDSIFYGVVKLENDDLNINNGQIHEKRKLKQQDTVLYLEERLPVKFIPEIYKNKSRLIVITPNWICYEEIERNTPEGMCAEPTTSFVVYDIRHLPSGTAKDSTIFFGEYPILHFAK